MYSTPPWSPLRYPSTCLKNQGLKYRPILLICLQNKEGGQESLRTSWTHACERNSYFVGLGVLSQGSCHDHGWVQRVLDALHKRVLFVLRRLGEALADVLQTSDRLVAQLHPRLGRDDLDLSGNQEAQSSTGPRHGMEQVHVLLLCVCEQKTILSVNTDLLLNLISSPDVWFKQPKKILNSWWSMFGKQKNHFAVGLRGKGKGQAFCCRRE